MTAPIGADRAPGDSFTTVERTSEREVVVARTFRAPALLVFEAWTRPERLQRRWAPRSCGVYFVSCEANVRTGGAYRFAMGRPGLERPLTFSGRYVEVTPPSRLVWTNEESHGAGQVATATFETVIGGTRIVMHDLYLSKTALDQALASRSMEGFGETFAQLDAVLAAANASSGR